MALVFFWLQHNLDIVFFIYGLAFLLMGVAILVRLTKKSKFRLADNLWLLALFGLTHGTSEFLDMWAIIKGEKFAFDVLRWLTLLVSYLFLFEFGRRVFRLTGPGCPAWRKKIAKIPSWWLSPLFILFIVMVTFISLDFSGTSKIWIRYLLGFPGALLASLGFFSYYKCEEETLKPLRLKKYFLSASLVFLAYSILGGLIGPGGNFFPANWLNQEALLLVTKIPVQIFRCLCAITAMWAVVGIMHIFDWETTKEIQDALQMKDKVTEGIEEAILLIDRDFKIIWANKKVMALTGLKPGEIIGNHCYKVTHNRQEPCILPDDICPIKEVIDSGKPITVLHTHFDKAGKPFYVEVSAYPIRDEKGRISQFVHIARDVTQRMKLTEELKRAKGELEVYAHKLEELVKTRTEALEKAMAESERQKIAILNMLEDVNEAHKQLVDLNKELGRAQEQVIQSAKMAAVGQLASGVAHEINNPLTGVLNYVQLIKIEIEDKKEFNFGEFKEILDIIEDSALRCAKITKSLLDFSRASRKEFQPLSLNELVGKVLALIGHELNLQNIVIKQELADNLPLILGDSQLLQQIVFNTIANARWAIMQKSEAGGQITLKTQYQPEKKTIGLYISDTGIGISPENLKRMFEPFFTTKPVGEGVGLGLSILYSIVKDHGGTVEVESQAGQGATFKVYLPVYEKKADQ